uniref:Protein kinase domain-containing protein n=1 Tax=Populus trichocarpa TaxID=3694 RepID=A0A2K2AX06_POPTR|eukprot:XP_024455720.1 wall-associated receptor kinase 2 [Populus trichocarpa]
MWVFLLMMSLLLCPVAASTARPDVKPGCQDKCGDVSVPYPFGIGEQSCAMNKPFFLNCTSGTDGQPELLIGTIRVHNISVLEGTVTVGIYAAFDCYNKTGNRTDKFSQHIRLGSGPFMFSDTRNVFTAIGCDTFAQVTNKDLTYGAACLSICTEYVNMSDGNPCSGSGCCKTSIPKGLKSLNISTFSYNNHTNVSDFNPCGFAFLVDRSSLKLSDWRLSRKPKYDKDAYTTDVVVEWVVKNETCEKANKTSAYACGTNANCTDSENQGYRCLCEKGFEGNPYLPDGCQDMDECKVGGKNACEEGTCENVIGDYKCRCPLGKYGDGKTGCKGVGIITIIAAVGASIFLVVICLLLYMICTKRIKEKNFQENGGKFLKNQRVRIFSEAELVKATNNYADDRKIGEGGFGSVYSGVLTDNTMVAVKKSKGVDKAQMNAEFQKEMSIVSQVNHKNVVKLLGLCLETKVPLLVYEFISNGTLSKHIHDKGSRILASWTNRLRVASEAALALDYLHSLADPPVIHGDVKSVNILLDNNHTTKVADFGASVLMSPGQTDILATKIQGTLGYLDPEYLMTGILTVQSDVYSFGVVLVELLTGEMPNSISKSGEKRNVIQHFISALENNHLFKILDFQTADEGDMDEIEAVAELAKGCLNSMGVNRPAMKEVSDELAKLKALHQKSLAHEKSEETDYLLGESSQSFCKNASPPMNQSHTVISLQMENYTNSI